VLLVVLLNPGLNGTYGLASVFTGYAVYPSYFQAKVILDGPKEAGDLSELEAYNFDVMSSYHPVDAVEDWSNKG